MKFSDIRKLRNFTEGYCFISKCAVDVPASSCFPVVLHVQIVYTHNAGPTVCAFDPLCGTLSSKFVHENISNFHLSTNGVFFVAMPEMVSNMLKGH